MEDGSYLKAVRAALAPRYRIEREIGHGAYATVFLATSVATSSEVAVKVLKPEWSQALAQERFLREIKMTAQLNHPNILPLLDSGDMGGFLFFVMPFVSGETLRQKLRRERQLTVEDVRRIAGDVAAGLSAAHAQGVLHRDVKPENILLQDGRAVVGDFGIAKAFTDSTVETITSTGLGVGTPPYMSPEQASGDRLLDVRTDEYALACVIFEMLAGETPHTGPTPQAIIAKKLSLPVPSILVLRERLSPGLDAVLQRALAKVRADRYDTVDAFMAALGPELLGDASTQTVSAPARLVQRVRARPVTAALGLAAAVALVAWLVSAQRAGGAGWVGGRPQSLAVIPLHAPGAPEQERALSGSLADAITRELNQWESIRAVPGVSLTGPMFDLGLAGPTLEREAEGIRVARQVRVQAMLGVLVRIQGDSVHAEATLIDVARGRQAQRPVLASAAVTDLAGLVRPIVTEVLGLGAGGNPSAMRRLSAFPEALVEYFAGMQSLDRGRLGEAEASFRRALAIDSTFGLAKYQLALSLYLGARGNQRRLTTLAPEIAQLSTSAAAHSSGLGHLDSLRIAAFHAFQSGDYDGARLAYSRILADDPTDVYALLLRGTVELRDPWLVALSDSTYRPRGNPNVAIRDLSEILRLRPTFDLGYDHLSEIHRSINNAAADRTICAGFERPRNQVLTPEGAITPEQQLSYCPVIVGDSIAWIEMSGIEAFGRARARSGAAQFFERYIALVRRWATYAPDEIRPQEEMVAALSSQRRRLGIAAPERIAAFADSARRFAEGALALKRDTTPDDLVRLGNIYLAVGDYARARQTTERGLQTTQSQGPAPRILAANPFLATGHPMRAMKIRSAVPLQRFIPDPATGELIPFGGVELPLARIQILGATGVGGAAMQHELRDVFRLWSESRYTDGQRRALREYVSLELAIALSLDPGALMSWDRNVSVGDPLWRALVLSLSDSAQARQLLVASFDSTTPTLTEATRSYLQGTIAGKVGDHRLAIARYSRIDSLPLATDVIDLGWGVRSLSELRRAESYEALGDSAAARKHYQAFLTYWASPDALARPLMQRAAGRLARLGKPS